MLGVKRRRVAPPPAPWDTGIAKALASRALFNLKSVRLDVHEPVGTCILHRADVCVSSADLSQTQ